MEEVWKDIPNYEGIYEASTHGRVRSKEGKVTYSKLHGEKKWKSRILKPKQTEKAKSLYVTGYRVSLWKDKKSKDFLVARLVATTFLDNLIDTNMTVNHIDGNRLNNNVDNLEWLSRSDNIKHGFETGLYNSIQKRIVLIDEYNYSYEFYSYAKCSRFLGRNVGYITNCLKNNRPITSSDNKVYRVLE